MLTREIRSGYYAATARLAGLEGVSALLEPAAGTGCHALPALYSVAGKYFLQHAELADEVFGPSSLLIECQDAAELRLVLEHLEGQLTATLLAAEADAEQVRPLLPLLERKVGRIIYNGYPTGVEVSHAMVHGGPYPATSDSRTTSVGGGAIDRFLRPVSYQNVPDRLLPEALQESNPLGVGRLVDGLPE